MKTSKTSSKSNLSRFLLCLYFAPVPYAKTYRLEFELYFRYFGCALRVNRTQHMIYRVKWNFDTNEKNTPWFQVCISAVRNETENSFLAAHFVFAWKLFFRIGSINSIKIPARYCYIFFSTAKVDLLNFVLLNFSRYLQEATMIDAAMYKCEECSYECLWIFFYSSKTDWTFFKKKN